METQGTFNAVRFYETLAKVEAYRKSMENFQKTIQKYQAQLRNNNKDKIKEYL